MVATDRERPWPLNGNWWAIPLTNRFYISALVLTALAGTALLSNDGAPIRVTSPWFTTVILAAAASLAVFYSQVANRRSWTNHSITIDAGSVFYFAAVLTVSPDQTVIVVTAWAVTGWLFMRQALYKFAFNWAYTVVVMLGSFMVIRRAFGPPQAPSEHPARFVAAVAIGSVTAALLAAVLVTIMVRLVYKEYDRYLIWPSAFNDARWYALSGALVGLWSVSVWWSLLALAVAIAVVNEIVGHGHMAASVTDVKTGLANAAGLREELAREVARARRHGKAFSIAILDLDYFKKINEVLGHLGGDRALERVGQLLIAAARQQDLVARWGGDELAWLMPETSLGDAVQTADRFRTTVAAQLFEFDKTTQQLSVSIGVADWQCSMTDEDILREADKALYKAKDAGRNAVHPTYAGIGSAL